MIRAKKAMWRAVRGWAICLLLLLGNGVSLAQAQSASDPAMSSGHAKAAPSATAYSYRLDSGDKIQITTYGEPSLSGTV